MTDKAVSALTSLTGATTATGDLLYIVDISEAAAADRSKKITAQELQNYLKAFPATIGVGGATPAASGAGISFPATASASSDANTLDDYEEGSWTPSITGASSSPTGISYSNQIGRYRKIGSLVIAHFVMQGTITGAGSGGVQLNGLPFASDSSATFGGTQSAVGYMPAGTYTFVPASDSYIGFGKVTAGAGLTGVSWGETNVSASDFQMHGVVIYRAA